MLTSTKVIANFTFLYFYSQHCILHYTLGLSEPISSDCVKGRVFLWQEKIHERQQTLLLILKMASVGLTDNNKWKHEQKPRRKRLACHRIFAICSYIEVFIKILSGLEYFRRFTNDWQLLSTRVLPGCTIISLLFYLMHFFIFMHFYLISN